MPRNCSTGELVVWKMAEATGTSPARRTAVRTRMGPTISKNTTVPKMMCCNCSPRAVSRSAAMAESAMAAPACESKVDPSQRLTGGPSRWASAVKNTPRYFPAQRECDVRHADRAGGPQLAEIHVRAVDDKEHHAQQPRESIERVADFVGQVGGRGNRDSHRQERQQVRNLQQLAGGHQRGDHGRQQHEPAGGGHDPAEEADRQPGQHAEKSCGDRSRVKVEVLDADRADRMSAPRIAWTTTNNNSNTTIEAKLFSATSPIVNSVSGPSLRLSFSTSTVVAGAVASASAPNSTAVCQLSPVSVRSVPKQPHAAGHQDHRRGHFAQRDGQEPFDDPPKARERKATTDVEQHQGNRELADRFEVSQVCFRNVVAGERDRIAELRRPPTRPNSRAACGGPGRDPPAGTP